MNQGTSTNDSPAVVHLTVRGQVPHDAAEYAVAKVQHLVDRLPDHIQQVHVVLSLAANPAQATPAGVEVEAEIGGTPLHVHVMAGTLTEAADEASDRLRRQLTDLQARVRSRRRTRLDRRSSPTDRVVRGDGGPTAD